MKKELKMDHSLDVLNRKISKYIREHKDVNIDEFRTKLREFAKEEEQIYELNEDIIERVIREYLKDITG